MSVAVERETPDNARFRHMMYHIEYLRETTHVESVCHTLVSHRETLDDAEADAVARSALAKAFGATGFQIRRLNGADEIVSIKEFANG